MAFTSMSQAQGSRHWGDGCREFAQATACQRWTALRWRYHVGWVPPVHWKGTPWHTTFLSEVLGIILNPLSHHMSNSVCNVQHHWPFRRPYLLTSLEISGVPWHRTLLWSGAFSRCWCRSSSAAAWHTHCTDRVLDAWGQRCPIALAFCEAKGLEKWIYNLQRFAVLYYCSICSTDSISIFLLFLLIHRILYIMRMQVWTEQRGKYVNCHWPLTDT